MPKNFPEPARRRALRTLAALGAAVAAPRLSANPATGAPVRVGLTAELRMASSTSDDAISLGLSLAMQDINARGGVLGGRPLLLEVRDDRSVPSRGVENLKAFAEMPDLVAVFGSRFSPVLVDMAREAGAVRCPVFSVWGAANQVLDPRRQPDWAFRVSLNDAWAMRALLKAAHDDKVQRVGLLLPNTGWGRSCHESVEAIKAQFRGLEVLPVRWYNWGGERSLIDHVIQLRQQGMQSLVLVSNEPEASVLCKEMLARPAGLRVPVYSHWGIAGGDFPALVGEGLRELDLRVVQTTALGLDRSPRGASLLQRAAQAMKVADPRRVPSLVGLGHAYDAMHLLAAAVDRSRGTDRGAVRDALENLPPIDGVVRRYAPAFTAQRHEALSESDVIMARWDEGGRLHRLDAKG